METAESHGRHRLVLIALSAVGVAFAWLVISLFGGIGASDARADDSDPSGLLGGVTSLVDEVASGATATTTQALTQAVTAVVEPAAATVTTTVAPVAAPVVQVVQPTVEPVVAPVAQVVAPVTQVVAPVTEAVAPVVTAVETVVADVSVGAVAAPVVDAVASVPVVGGVISTLGVDTAVTSTASTIDRIVDTLTGFVPDAGPVLSAPPVIGSPVLGTSPLAGLAATGQPMSSMLRGLADPAAVAHTTATRQALTSTASTAPLASDASASASASVTPGGGSEPAAPTLFPGPCGVGGMSSAGSGSSGSGGAALLAFGPLLVHRAWVRRRAPRDDQVPPAPAASTDVSPD
ncbi:hypothetical protein ACFM35_11625 [Microbacterium sp. P01]|uniref:hypothetical protein n=1 Tax=Microbacterium sp. P01 TaxID=3366261 RepID=UPI003670D2F3